LTPRRPTARLWRLAVAICLCSAALGGCGDAAEEPAERTPAPAPSVTLTPEDRDVWAPAPPDRSKVPVLLYHGIAPVSGFANETDAEYGLDPQEFAKQMTLLDHAGYQTITLEQLVRFVAGEQVDLPPRPLLLTFDDARADSWTGGDGILEKLGFNAVMFVDVGRVEDGDPEYLTWAELETVHESGRWDLQLHSGDGHRQIEYAPDEFGPFYAYRESGESLEDWRDRVFSDIAWGGERLAAEISAYRPLGFAPPYGNYGQDGTNDERIPVELLAWLRDRYRVIFTQDRSFFARPDAEQPLGRLQVTRGLSGGDLHSKLGG
jgi:peptidoglycan/xylan/chitin deacetylase (PgdA/CDA1 family)